MIRTSRANPRSPSNTNSRLMAESATVPTDRRAASLAKGSSSHDHATRWSAHVPRNPWSRIGSRLLIAVMVPIVALSALGAVGVMQRYSIPPCLCRSRRGASTSVSQTSKRLLAPA